MKVLITKYTTAFLPYFITEVVLKHLAALDTNQDIADFANSKAFPQTKYLNIKLSSGYDARVRLQLPPNADLTGKIKYPLLVDVYAGPDSYNGFDKWDLTWGDYLASSKSIIYAQINGRGSGLRGDNLMHEIYYGFGTVEVEDQIETTK